jgi:thiol-disulfide isomerase/thioredoxin
MLRTSLPFRSVSKICRSRRRIHPDIVKRAFFPVVPVVLALVLCLLERQEQQQHRFYFTCRGLVLPYPGQRHRNFASREKLRLDKARHVKSPFTGFSTPSLSPETTSGTTITFTTTTTTTTTTTLFGVVMDPPSSSSSSSFSRGKESNDDDHHTPSDDDVISSSSSSSSWIPTANGVFFANIPHPIRLLRRRRQRQPQLSPLQQRHDLEEEEHSPPISQLGRASNKVVTAKKIKTTITQVTDLIQYKKEVVDVRPKDFEFVAVRFYAPWCKACRAVERPFRRLATHTDFSTVKFVEVPVTKENAYLHQGLGIPSLPFAHIYQFNKDITADSSSSSTTTLVEEMKINIRAFSDFKQTLHDYVNGQCSIVYSESDVILRESNSNNTATATEDDFTETTTSNA